MKIFQAILLAAALGVPRAYGGFFPDNAFSDDARGLTAAQFLKVPPSARFAALVVLPSPESALVITITLDFIAQFKDAVRQIAFDLEVEVQSS